MSSDSFALESAFMPEEPLRPDGAAFFNEVTGMLDGNTKDHAVVEAALSGWEGLLAQVASKLYRIGSMLLGEGEQVVDLIENVVTSLDINACRDSAEARHNARLILGARAIEILRERGTSTFSVPTSEDSSPVSCIEDDDLEAAGVTRDELERMLSGSDNQDLRIWIEGLALPLRVIFVLRAIAVLSTVEIAAMLAEHGGPDAEDWTPDSVRSSFRQALCSLASQLIHSSVTK